MHLRGHSSHQRGSFITFIRRTHLVTPLSIVLGLALLAQVTPFTEGKTPTRAIDGEIRLASAPAPSGADRSYPANHTFDGTNQTALEVPNGDFEAPSEGLGGPTNFDLEQTAISDGPTNGDFESGTFQNWTVVGTPSLENDATHGYWTKFTSSSQNLTSEEISVSTTAQAVVYDIGYLNPTHYSGLYVYVLSGPDFATSTVIKTDYCYKCASAWKTSSVDVSAYRGQTVKLQFKVQGQPVGLDRVSIQEAFPGFETSAGGQITRNQDPDGNDYATLSSGSFTSPAFTVDQVAQQASVRVKATNTSGEYRIRVATGPSFSSYSLLKFGAPTTDWSTISFDVSDYQGQEIKVRVDRLGTISFDDIGLLKTEVPEWSVSGHTNVQHEIDGNSFVATRGSLVSAPLEIPENADNFSFRTRGVGASSTYYTEILRGPDFSTVVQLKYDTMPTEWTTYHWAIGKYAGETVKIRIRRYSGAGTLEVDDVSPIEATLPGWRPTQNGGFVSAQDSHGTYVMAPDGPMGVRSTWISSAMLDTATNDARSYAISYDLTDPSGGSVYVGWEKENGQTITLTQGGDTAPTGFKTRYFTLFNNDIYGRRGRFIVQAAEGAKIYSIADNAASQQLSEPFSRKVGHGIDTTTGAVAFHDQDIALPGTMPLSFTRYYNSHSDRLGAMGYRWSHSFDTRLVFAELGNISVVFGSGREELFDQSGANYVSVDPRVQSTLVGESDGTYTLTTKDNLEHHFTSAGKLTSIEDLNGNTTSLSYDTQGRLDVVTAPGSMTLWLDYSASGELISVTDPAGATYTYGYNTAGDLTSVTDPELGIRSYTYEQHRLTSVTDENGHQEVANSFDDVGRVISQTDANDEQITVSYDTPGQGATRIIDPEGGQATYYFDRWQRTTHAVDPEENVVENLFDANGNLDKIIDPASNQWDFAFDSSGDLTSTADPLGNPVSFTYNAKHLPTTVTDANGNVTTFTYDSEGNTTSITDALGEVTTFTHDAAGNVLTETDPFGKTTTHTYDGKGNRTSTTNPLGKTWTKTYDSAGRLKTEVDPLGNTTTYFYDLLGRVIMIRDPLLRETHFLFDPAGHLLRVTDPEGNETTWAYNDRGLVRSKTDPEGNETTYLYDANRNMISMSDPLNHTTTWGWDDAGRLSSETDALGNTTTYTYNPAGQLATKTDPLDRETSYTYDSAGHVTTMTLPNDGVIAYAYDDNGNLTQMTDPGGDITTYAYDEVNRLETETNPMSQVTSYDYDDAGRLLTETDPRGEITTFGYDDAGQQTSVTDPLGNVTENAYDLAGRLISVTDPTERVTSYAYDAAGQMTSVTDPAGEATVNAYDDAGNLTSVTTPRGAVTSYAYDGRGLTTSVTDPLLKVSAFAYDDAGRLLTETDPMGHVTSYGYDAADRQTTMTDDLDGVVTFAYDDAGQMTALTDPRNETWNYAYDLLGNRTSITDPLTNETEFGYDVEGQQTSRTDANGAAVTYGYNDAGRPTGITHPGGSISYSYDAAGRRTGMTDVTRPTTFGYDDAGRMTSVATPAGTVSYGYDGAGRKTSMTLPGTRTVDYNYDTAGRLDTVTDWNDEVTSFDYDNDGNTTNVTRENGVETDVGYDLAGRVTSVEHTKSPDTLMSFSYTYNNDGNRTSVTTSAGTESYSYDELGRLTQASYPGGDVVSYAYDAAGNRTSETRNGVTSNYSYNDAGRLTSIGSKNFTYDDNGNMTSAGSDTFEWDWNNRLVHAEVGTHEADYTYDGDDVRVESTVDTTNKDFLVDRHGLPTVVDDGTSAFLHDGIAMSEIQGSSSKHALKDGLGSVRGLTDGTGAVVGSKSFDAFGATRASSGTQSMFGYTGEPSDATGLTHLRARDLDPSIGRMLSADTVQPNAPGTQGYNLYAYVANNPATWVDPTGNTATALSQLSVNFLAIALAVGALGSTLPVWIGVGFALLVVILACVVMDCLDQIMNRLQTIYALGAATAEGVLDWTIDRIRGGETKAFPARPQAKPVPVPIPVPNTHADTSTSSATKSRTQGGCALQIDRHTFPWKAHTAAKHAPGAGKGFSEFTEGAWAALDGLITAAQPTLPHGSPRGSGMCYRVVDRGFVVGHTASPLFGPQETSLYTVVTTMTGTLITTYPGPPWHAWTM
jgi:RHS repeat-associated protein